MELAEARLCMAGLLIDCPYESNPTDCALYDIRNKSMGEKLEFCRQMTEEQLQHIIAIHENCLSRKEGETEPNQKGERTLWCKQSFLSALRKIGPLAAFILMLTALLQLIYMMHTTYASLINYDASLTRLISGRTFIYGSKYPNGIKCWYMLFTFCSVILLPYTALARWFSHRKTRLAYWSFAIPTIALYLYLLLILSLPFSWLIHYINAMGFTPKRIYGLFYGLGGYILILTFLYWVLRRPNAHTKPSS